VRVNIRPVIGFFFEPSLHCLLVAGLFVVGCGDARQIDVQSNPDGLVGTVRALVVSYEDRAETVHQLVGNDGQEISLDFRQAGRRPQVGERIAVRGARDGSRMEVSSYDVLRASTDEVRQPLRAGSRERTIKIAAILLSNELSKEELARRLFTDVDSPAALCRENSYGAWTLEGDVYGPYAIDTTECALSKLHVIAKDADAAAGADGFDPSAYHNVMYYIGKPTPPAACDAGPDMVDGSGGTGGGATGIGDDGCSCSVPDARGIVRAEQGLVGMAALLLARRRRRTAP